MRRLDRTFGLGLGLALVLAIVVAIGVIDTASAPMIDHRAVGT